MSSTPYPATIAFTELDDAYFFAGANLDTMKTDSMYRVDDYCVGVIAYICNLVVMTPAFLVRHARLAASLYRTLEGLKKVAEAGASEDAKFEKKLYMYARHIIKVLVPGATQTSNKCAPMSPATFVMEFKQLWRRINRRSAYLFRRNPHRIHEEWHEYVTFMQTEFGRVRDLCYDPSQIDKAVVGLKKYIKFALLYNHVIGTSTAYSGLTGMIDDYSTLQEHLKAKKFPNSVFAGLTSLVSALQLCRNHVAQPEIPEPPADPPALQHEAPVLAREEEPLDGDWSDYIRRHAAEEEDEPSYDRRRDRRTRAERRAEDDLY